ncbi:putative ribosomal large subunit pseudouridine synthase SVR1, chloroplastic [Tripterygium wilfordii]|uniref:putative ribosomal large subunit pseudouridine synthase SVR1, chloroplastic n=1 Tax=Tripterygium wilfordii TaxID=458696 RepID=UPI0018F829E1|nr:putative ribosomal large subunit pseudouridine synthase SVR1, chloroplastic [Tripterygium wilfordii]
MATLSLSSSLFSKPFLPLKLKTFFHTLPRITCSAASSSSSTSSSLEFNITFAPPKPKPKGSLNDVHDSISTGSVPWIVRGEDGNLKLQTHPPVQLVHALADTKSANPTDKKKNKKKSAPKTPTPEPKYSKAARRFYNENFRAPAQRLSKVLAASGVASRRSCEELIFEGRVTVNGSVCNTPQTRVDTVRDIIYVNGNRLPKKLPPRVYLALNKPKGYICSSGKKESKTVMSLLDDYLKSWDKINRGVPKPRLFTVGRLDVATTGLIIITNDGDFAQALAHPSSNLTKEYIATIDGAVNKQHLIAISEGTNIEGVHCVPDSVELLPRQPEILRSRIRIVVHEGRNHEVRELVKKAGLEIHSLKRVRIAGYRLPSDLGLGYHVELKKADLLALGWKN